MTYCELRPGPLSLSLSLSLAQPPAQPSPAQAKAKLSVHLHTISSPIIIHLYPFFFFCRLHSLLCPHRAHRSSPRIYPPRRLQLCALPLLLRPPICFDRRDRVSHPPALPFCVCRPPSVVCRDWCRLTDFRPSHPRHAKRPHRLELLGLFCSVPSSSFAPLLTAWHRIRGVLEAHCLFSLDLSPRRASAVTVISSPYNPPSTGSLASQLLIYTPSSWP